jgi:hypothetical protein
MNHGFIATPSMGDIERLERRIAELEQRFENHGHTPMPPTAVRSRI